LQDCWQSWLSSEFDKKRKSFLDLKCPADKCTHFLDDLAPKLMSEETKANYDVVWKTIPNKATCFNDFNYEYDNDGILRNTINHDKFHWVNQAHYDALGDYIVEHIQYLMKTEYHMEEVWLPVGAGPEDPRCNIFISPGALEKEKLILLIQGSGAVRPGQWARALCINESLELGSILPYLKRIDERDWGVIVFNPNMNSVEIPGEGPDVRCREAFLSRKKIIAKEGTRKRIPGNESNAAHCVYVWDHFGAKAAASEICIIAHSAGGACTMALLKEREDDVLAKLRGIAFTDSVHWVSPRDGKATRAFIKNHAINWVRSDKPLDTPERGDKDDCPCISAGHEKHEYTSGCAIESVFKFLDSKFEK